MQQATETAARAYTTWKEVGVQHRQRVMLQLQHLIRQHTDELALAITTEQGHQNVESKVFSNASRGFIGVSRN